MTFLGEQEIRGDLLPIDGGFDGVWSQLNLGLPGMTMSNFFGIIVEAMGGGVGRASRG